MTRCCDGMDPLCQAHGVAASNARQNEYLREWEARRSGPRTTGAGETSGPAAGNDAGREGVAPAPVAEG